MRKNVKDVLVRINIKDEHNAIKDKELIEKSIGELLEKYNYFKEAHMTLHVKTAADKDQKHLVHIRGKLVTDKGSYFSESYAHNLREAHEDCLDSLKTQLDKYVEKLVDHRPSARMEG